jgi:hypothetical protein
MHLAARHPCLKCAVGRFPTSGFCDTATEPVPFFFWAALEQEPTAVIEKFGDCLPIVTASHHHRQ